MKRTPLPLIALLVAGLLAGCSPGTPAPSGPSAQDSPSNDVRGPTSAAVSPRTTFDGETAAGAPASGYRVTYPWNVPSTLVTVPHPVPVPPLRYLAQVRFGDHPGEDPAYTRVTFAFVGGLPTYRFSYVPAVPHVARAEPITLPGNAFLQITFLDARTTDDRGHTTERPSDRLGYPTVPGYGFGGDFEGHVIFGLGIQVAPGSDQALPVRVSESVRPDGTHVVSVDVRRG
jgi:hypothetical protein